MLKNRGLVAKILSSTLWPDAIDDAIGNAEYQSRSHDAVIRVYDAAGNVIETHEHKSELKEP